MDGSRAGWVMPNEFIVVGESKTDSQCLLVEGSDGRYYSYHPRRKGLARVDVDERWLRYDDHDHDDRDDERDRPKKRRATQDH